MQQNTRSRPCPSCGQNKMRSGQQASTHGKVNGVQVCDDCKVKDILNSAINRKAN